MTGKFDGTIYNLEQAGHAASTHSPHGKSILGVVVSAMENIERVVEGRSTDATAELQQARELMRGALERTRRVEPCLRRYEPEP